MDRLEPGDVSEAVRTAYRTDYHGGEELGGIHGALRGWATSGLEAEAATSVVGLRGRQESDPGAFSCRTVGRLALSARWRKDCVKKDECSGIEIDGGPGSTGFR